MKTPILAPSASHAFNAWLWLRLQTLAGDLERALGDDLVALVLAGGFGRGDGGVTRRGSLELAYNDLDFVLVVRRRRARHAAILARIGAEHEAHIGVPVEFGRPVTERDIRSWPQWLLWHDVVHGHVVVYGPDDIVRRNAPASIAGAPPLIEASRLLLNRGAGLLRALRVAHGTEPSPDDDFVVRNAHKCAQAIGDALLIGAGIYAPTLAERHVRLRRLLLQTNARDAQILRWHERALRFRQSPGQPDPWTGSLDALEELSRLWHDVFRELERLDPQRARTARSGVREPEEHHWRQWPRNLVRRLQSGAVSLRHPRERLYRFLPSLLQTPAPTPRWSQQSARTLALWARVH